MTDEQKLSVTDDPQVGDDDDRQKSKKVWVTSPQFFKAVFFVLSRVGIGTINIEPIQQQLSDEHLFWKLCPSRGK